MLSKNVADLLGDVERLDDPTDLIERVLREARRVGLDYVAANGSFDMATPSESDILHAGMPEDWTNYYLESGFLTVDPVLRAGTSSLVPFKWQDVERRFNLTRAEMTVMNEARNANLKNGLLIPVHAPGGYSGIVSFAGEVSDLPPEAMADLHIASIYLHDRLRATVSEQTQVFPPGTPLTPREAECLHWMAMGKSDWEIGEILAISEHTVKQHASRVKQKFGVHTRVQAVVEAIRQALIRL